MFKVSDAFNPAYTGQDLTVLWKGITTVFSVDEDLYVQQLIKAAETSGDPIEQITGKAHSIIQGIRDKSNTISMIDALMQQYSLNTDEGILLMCLAEALIRVPDSSTADAFIRDRLGRADWSKHHKQSDSLLVNASTWGLLISGKVLKQPAKDEPTAIWNRLTGRLGEPVIRAATGQAMKVLGNHFVLGQSIKTALNNSESYQKKGYTYSFDMLGEAALTAEDAAFYKDSYILAMEAIGENNKKGGTANPSSISIKLSALHPRYEKIHEERILQELGATILDLIRLGRQCNVGITIDAEEADRLEISLQLFEQAFTHPDCKGWGEFGLVVQAYSKRALPVLTWLHALAARQEDRIPVRLVKGAYWDTEIKHAQEAGEEGYSVFTRKEATDLSYLTCVRFLLDAKLNRYIFPQFASHNPHTLACILEMATHKNFELQRLHGMGDILHEMIFEGENIPVRIYAPVGNHKDLLPYLVRRLLENGANSSFVHRLADAQAPIDELVKHPLHVLKQRTPLRNPHIPLPCDILPGRKNSRGTNIAIEDQWQELVTGVNQYMDKTWTYGPMIDGQNCTGDKAHTKTNPANKSDQTGTVYWTDSSQVEQALSVAVEGFPQWNQTPATERAERLNTLADLLEEHRDELIAICHREAGKTVLDCIDEIREAVDFCRYYAQQAVELFDKPLILPGPTGESNELSLLGRGVFVCISPWNFPLAIFLGQISAALAAGNTVLAKPAEQTCLIAGYATELAWKAGIPANALQLLPGDGASIGNQLMSDNRVSGAAFTGSTQTAMLINQRLAERKAPIAPFIAETGGQNAMIIDSTALPEQVVTDAVRSAFASAGQRCSALRVMYIQKDIAERVITLLKGAMNELVVGNPAGRSTDVGPIIDEEAVSMLQTHIKNMETEDRLIARAQLTSECDNGYFIPPVAFQLDSISQLEKENFGPILHIITFEADKIDQVIDEINATGYGLTLGIHSRNETVSDYIAEKVNAGNVYINRNQVGAVVGVQPFGGMGLSGTGPKAGGPRYIYRFAVEKHRSINTTAIGGNASLLVQGAGENGET